MSRCVVCPCEDVLKSDVEKAVARGYRDIESVKRYTGFGTGVCQGKSCLVPIARLICELTGAEPASMAPITPRPPHELSAIGALAGAPEQPVWPPAGERVLDSAPKQRAPVAAAARERRAELTGPPSAERPPLPPRAEIVIVGGGIMGLCTAYNLARLGKRDVVVLEQSYINSGASGRCGGGVRMQWSTELNVRLMKESVDLCKAFAKELGINIWFRQGGYLFLATTPAEAARLEKNVELHRRLDVDTRLLSEDEARSLVPELGPMKVLAATYNRDDGVVFPWPFLWGYANGAIERGVRVETFTRVTGVETAGGRVTAVATDRGRIACDVLINAAGAWSPALARMCGVELPNKPYRHEILVTEPLKPFLAPLVVLMRSGLYVSQSMRGELVGGLSDSREPVGLEQRSSFRFLARMTAGMAELMPVLKDVRIVRQWAGCYDVTPDHNPVMGPVPGLSNFLQANGFVGHGFMMAPAVGRILAEYVARGRSHELIERMTLERFIKGELIREEMIIG